MSGELAIGLALLIFASNWACYKLGQLNIVTRYEEARRRREREARWQEFDDED